MDFSQPELLTARHQIDDFDSGDPQLDDWLKERALVNQLGRRRCTYVVTDETGLVRGYYLMVAGGVSYKLGNGKGQRRMPDPVPVLVMPRIAVDKDARVHQLGPSLFRDALERAEAMSQHAGVKAFLVYALDDRSRQFYLDHGFQPSVLDPTVLALRLPTLTV
jgi:GNAT superfamily N-acetyltransferase